MEKNFVNLLKARALQLRIDSVCSTTESGSGHPTTALSAADIVATLFFHAMSFDIKNPFDKNNDRFVLSKGHGVPVLYAAYKQLGVISDEELMKLRDFDSPLEGHPTPRFVYNEAATGSLGQGLAIAAGIALNAKKEKRDYQTYVLLGDGEIAEGSVWEAAEFASYYNLNNLVGIVDCNRLGQTGETMLGHDCDKYSRKFEAFGWESVIVDGHDVEQIIGVLGKERARPLMIIAKTHKGHGIDQIENKNGFHGKPLGKDELDSALESLKKRFADESEFLLRENVISERVETNFKAPKLSKIALNLSSDPNKDLFAVGQLLATRKAFGYALAAAGRESDEIFALDADVKNSTFTQIFEKEFSDRFVQCFIAEQTMVGVAIGLQSRGKIPFAATFGAFFSRAHDQIRMASVGRNALRLCGSHCGVSIGEDGPSQMGLEDISMMRSIPDSVVLYPSDAVSTYSCVEKMANYHDGISYMRTTRSATPVLYELGEDFEIGGCKVLRQSDDDIACIVAAGITLHEALKAHDRLKKNGVFISVIDAYSVKPIDADTIIGVAKKSGNKIVVVEDHYIEGGLGEAVSSAVASCENSIVFKLLGVNKISRSGKPNELMADAGIDAQSIVAAVTRL